MGQGLAELIAMFPIILLLMRLHGFSSLRVQTEGLQQNREKHHLSILSVNCTHLSHYSFDLLSLMQTSVVSALGEPIDVTDSPPSIEAPDVRFPRLQRFLHLRRTAIL